MNRQDIIDRLKKIKSLSEKGVGGEKGSAERHLEELMKKYGITEEDLNEEEIAVERFFNACENMDLFAQIVCKIFGKKSSRFKRRINRDYRLYFTQNGELGDVDFTNSVVCTKAEFVEIKFVYETYLADYKKQLDIFFYAYLEKNDLLMPCDEEKEPTREEKEIAYKAGMMANGIDKKIIKKARVLSVKASCETYFNEEAQKQYPNPSTETIARINAYGACMEMSQWKDEQHKQSLIDLNCKLEEQQANYEELKKRYDEAVEREKIATKIINELRQKLSKN